MTKQFSSQKELWEHLIAGGTITHKTWASDRFVRLENGETVCDEGEYYSVAGARTGDWHPYTPPKQKRKVTLYRYTYKGEAGIVQSMWMEQCGWPYAHISGWKLLLTETKEVEIDDE